jgi:hypothetical protein
VSAVQIVIALVFSTLAAVAFYQTFRGGIK